MTIFPDISLANKSYVLFMKQEIIKMEQKIAFYNANIKKLTNT